MNSNSYSSEEEYKSLLRSKAVELFKLCDTEEKGFITKKDMQRMINVVGLDSDVLEDVYDSLDRNNNGYLTIEEFLVGFTNYLGGFNDQEQTCQYNGDETEEDVIFKETLESLGAKNLFEDEQMIKKLWIHLRKEDFGLQKYFESVLEHASKEIRRSKIEYLALESALNNKTNVYDEEMKKLYEEMEAQIKVEKCRLQAQEKIRERELKDRFLHEINEKEKQLQEAINRTIELETKFFKMNLSESSYKQQHDKLLKDKADIEYKLQESVKELQEAKNYIASLQEQTKNDKRNRAKEVLELSENLAIERESLLREVDILKNGNKKLKDERDELKMQLTEIVTLNNIGQVQTQKVDEPAIRKNSNVLVKQGSLLSSYFDTSLEMDELSQSMISDSESNYRPVNTSQYTKHLPERENLNQSSMANNAADILNVPVNATPDRVFKIIFIGESGVGKTSFVQRFCSNSFKESFSTTIGVDFQVKALNIDNKIIALQLWDTAGQERFRSLTKQYFRKSDCVICMYDVTSEQTFKSVRNWINSVMEYAEEDILIVIVGNKTDLCENDSDRAIKFNDGIQLADEFKAMFFETSSKTNKGILEGMEAVARILKEKEDKTIDDVLNLRVKEKKKGCSYCSKQ